MGSISTTADVRGVAVPAPARGAMPEQTAAAATAAASRRRTEAVGPSSCRRTSWSQVSPAGPSG